MFELTVPDLYIDQYLLTKAWIHGWARKSMGVGKGLGAGEWVWQGLLNKEKFSVYIEHSQSIQHNTDMLS